MFRRNQSEEQLRPRSRAALSDQYWRQLLQLLDAKEISIEVARQVERDMFEPRAAGQPPRLNDVAWQIHLNERQSAFERILFKAING